MCKLLLSIVFGAVLMIGAEYWNTTDGLTVKQMLGTVLSTGKMIMPGRG